MQVELLDHQYDFMACEKKYALLLGGIGAGKTYSGAIYTVKTAIEFPWALGGIFANTYKQLQNSTLKALFNILTDLGISFEFNQNKSILKINNSQLLCMSLENYDAIRGVELGYAWIDECAFAREEAWSVISGRLRDKRGPLQLRLTSSPRGYNWLYDYFAGDKKTKDFEVFHSSTKSNPHLPQSYVDTLYEQYDSKLVEQELEGKFTNVQAGRIYYAFDRQNNVSESVNYEAGLPIHIGMDFNVNPMTATLSHITNDSIKVFDEMFVMTSNTDELAKLITEKYGTGHSIIPDATGKAIKTSAAGLSDHEILKRAGFKVQTTRNPHRVDRYNTLNSLLEKKRILINSKCVKLIRDLEQVSYKEGTNLPDTSNSELGHISDTLGYKAFFFFPIIPSRVATVRKYA